MPVEPLLQELFEQAAAALDLHGGVHALVLRLAAGELVRVHARPTFLGD